MLGVGCFSPGFEDNTTKKSREYIEYFNDESIKIINEVYSNDFKLLGYEKL